MKYPEGQLIIKISGHTETAGSLGLEPTTAVEQVDAQQHLNQLCALFEDLGLSFDDLHTFYDDVSAGLNEEYNRLPKEGEYPAMSLSGYDRWFRDILEATHIAHTHFHEQQLQRLQALETSSTAFIKKIIPNET